MLGNAGENYAENLLTQKGYKVIDRNFRCRIGEVDVIAIKDGVLVFVEVKTRKNRKFGLPEESVTPQKIYKIRRTGEWYVSQNPGLPKKHRIDVVSLVLFEGKVINEKIISAI